MSAFASVTPPVSSLLDRKHETHREVPDICMCHIGCKCFVCVLCWIFPLLPPFFLPSVVSKWQMTLTFWHILSEARNRAGWRSPNIMLIGIWFYDPKILAIVPSSAAAEGAWGWRRLQKSSWWPYPKLIVCSEIALEGVRWYSTPWNALSRCADFYGSSKWFIPLRLCMSNKHWELFLVNSITVRWFWLVIEKINHGTVPWTSGNTQPLKPPRDRRVQIICDI